MLMIDDSFVLYQKVVLLSQSRLLIDVYGLRRHTTVFNAGYEALHIQKRRPPEVKITYSLNDTRLGAMLSNREKRKESDAGPSFITHKSPGEAA